jgi:DNA polymerase-4
LTMVFNHIRRPCLFVIQPEDVQTFLPPLPVGRIPGVGKVTETRLKQMNILTVRDLQALESAALEAQFGRYGTRLYELARGIDHNKVIPDRPTKSISAEDTFERDIPLAETEALIRRLAEKVWMASRKDGRVARTIVLKLKTSEFTILTRSHTPGVPPESCGNRREFLAVIWRHLRRSMLTDEKSSPHTVVVAQFLVSRTTLLDY